jgi:uncharacterized phiE125 gp8 family phage protein
MDLRRISPAIKREDKLRVVTVDQVKAQARVPLSDKSEDSLIESYIVSAYDYLSGPEGWLGRCCLLDEEWEAYVGMPDRLGIELPMRPLREDQTIAFDYFRSDDYTAVDTKFYFVSTVDSFPRICRTRALSWPYHGIPYSRAYRMRFTAGFGGPDDIPEPIKLAIRMLCAHWLTNRETVGPDGRSVGEDVKYGLRALCGRYRVALDHS